MLQLTLLPVVYAALVASSFASESVSPKLQTGFYNNSDGSPAVAFIERSKASLYIEIYEMDDPKVIAAIRKALKRGVTVHVVKEPKPVGGSCRVFEAAAPLTGQPEVFGVKAGGASCADQQKLVAEVNDAGGDYVPFTKPVLCGGGGTKSCLEHGKIMISDSNMALITTGNFNTTNLCDLDYAPSACNRDYTYLSDDASVVETLQKVIEMDIIGERYDVGSVMSPGAEDKLTVGPNSLAPLVSFIETAKERIQIENQYLKEPTINSALIAAAQRGVGILLAIDEVQYLDESEFGALISAVHRTTQLDLPVIVTGAGLPQLPALAGNAKSYAERLFKFPRIDSLTRNEADAVLAIPAGRQDVKFSEAALDHLFEVTHGYPYFLQVWGHEVWNAASASPISADDVDAIAPYVITGLDENFFRVRFDRLTPSEREYLRAMAEIGPGPHRSGDIAAALNVKVESVAPRRSALIKKGMIYSPAHGDTAFTVPLFDEFLKRVMPAA